MDLNCQYWNSRNDSSPLCLSAISFQNMPCYLLIEHCDSTYLLYFFRIPDDRYGNVGSIKQKERCKESCSKLNHTFETKLLSGKWPATPPQAAPAWSVKKLLWSSQSLSQHHWLLYYYRLLVPQSEGPALLLLQSGGAPSRLRKKDKTCWPF